MSTDTIMGIVGGAIAGLIITHIYYRIQKRRRELCWSLDSANLIKGYSSHFEKLEVEYGGEKIENLTVSKIAFWNNGNETIDRNDIAIHPHIFPTEDDMQILDVKVIKSSTIGNRFVAEIPENQKFIALDFDYLDSQQGAVIQVIHTAVSVLPLWVHGQVKGVKNIEYKSKRPDITYQIGRWMMYFYALMMSALVGAYVYSSIFLGKPVRADWTVWVLGVLWILVLVVIYIDIRDRSKTAKIPKDLSVFERDDMGLRKRQ